MKLKNILLSGLSLVLVAALAIGGTVAYLQDDDSDVNVMTLGNVKIEQHEYQRAEGVAHDEGEPGAGNGVKEGALVPFVQGQALYPAVPKNNAGGDYTAEMDTANLFFWGDYVYSGTAGNGLWDDSKLSNVMDKMVFVENTGKSDAYIRTVIAFECPEGITIGEPSQGAEIMINTNIGTYDWDDVGYITVDGVRYAVMTATYKKVLAPGNQSHPSLLQVVMTHHATNEDVALLGDTYEILVVSQAVQVAGFADAETALNAGFGDITTTNHPWVDGVKVPVMVSNADELKAAIVSGEDVVLTDDITVDQWVMYSETKTIGNGQIITVDEINMTIDGNGHSLTVNSVESAGNGGYLFDDASNLNIRNLTINMNCDAGAIDLESGVIENVVFNYRGVCIMAGDGDITVKNCVFNTAAQTIYYETARDNLKIIDNTFNIDAAANVVILRGGEIFTGNTVNSGRTVNILNDTITVSDNIFNCRVKLYQEGQKLSGNIFEANAYIDIEDGITVDVSGNYWGGGKPSATQIPSAIKNNVVVKNYYGTYADGELSNLLP